MKEEPVHILMVCTGNNCRSPLAEVIAERYATERGRNIVVQSASTLGLDGRLAHKNSVRVAKEIGLDLSGHQSQPLTRELMEWADFALGMEIMHAGHMRERYPEADDKIMLLGTFGGVYEISDPIGGWRWKFRKTRGLIEDCVHAFIDRLPVD